MVWVCVPICSSRVIGLFQSLFLPVKSLLENIIQQARGGCNAGFVNKHGIIKILLRVRTAEEKYSLAHELIEELLKSELVDDDNARDGADSRLKNLERNLQYRVLNGRVEAPTDRVADDHDDRADRHADG